MNKFHFVRIPLLLTLLILFCSAFQKFATAKASDSLLKLVNEDEDFNQNYAKERSQWQPIRFHPSRSRHATVMFLQGTPELTP